MIRTLSRHLFRILCIQLVSLVFLGLIGLPRSAVGQEMSGLMDFAAHFGDTIIRISFESELTHGVALITIVGQSLDPNAEFNKSGDTIRIVSRKKDAFRLLAVIQNSDSVLHADVILNGAHRQLAFEIDTSFEHQLHLYKELIQRAIVRASRSELRTFLHPGLLISENGRLTHLGKNIPNWVYTSLLRKKFVQAIAGSSAYEDTELHEVYLLGSHGEVSIQASEELGMYRFEVTSIDFGYTLRHSKGH